MKQLGCPHLANYCDITANQSRFSEADAVVYHMRDPIDRYQARKKRLPHQRFVFSLWESPIYTPSLKSYENFFNWAMTYRLKSHIVTSYYFRTAYLHTSSDYYKFLVQEITEKRLDLQFRTADYQLTDEILANKKLGTAAALISNCGTQSLRMAVIKRLQRFIDVTIYGRCGAACPPNIDCREFIGKNYFFFLSFENSLCKDYAST